MLGRPVASGHFQGGTLIPTMRTQQYSTNFLFCGIVAETHIATTPSPLAHFIPKLPTLSEPD